jgi:hypothetical protein
MEGKHLKGKAIPVTPWRSIKLWDVEAAIFSLDSRLRLSALRAGCHLPPGRFLVLISVRGWVKPWPIVRLEGLGQLKKSTSSGLELATFRLLTQTIFYFNAMGSIISNLHHNVALYNFRFISMNPVQIVDRNDCKYEPIRIRNRLWAYGLDSFGSFSGGI